MDNAFLLKFSGEALSDHSGSIAIEVLAKFADDVKSLKNQGASLAIVVGGGNILRGSNSTLTRFRADNIGMLATLMNAIAIEDALLSHGVNAVVLSSFEVNKICEYYNAQRANYYLQQGYVVICAGGIANPFFSTDTCAVIRAAEMGLPLVLKGTQVDGVFNKDPRQHDDAMMYQQIAYDDVINQQLKIMDLSAIIVAKEQKVKIRVFNLHQKHSIQSALAGKIGSIIL